MLLLAQNPANGEAANFDSKSFEDLHRYPTIAERRITCFHFNNEIDERLTLSFPAGVFVGFIGVQYAVLSFYQRSVKA